MASCPPEVLRAAFAGSGQHLLLYFRVRGCKQKDIPPLETVDSEHDQTGTAERVSERQADGGRGGDLPRR